MSRRTRAVGLLGMVLPLVLVAGVAWNVNTAVTSRSQSSFFTQDGVRIRYSEVGEGEPLILLHGFAVHGDLQWNLTGYVDALSKHYRLIVPDLRGHGLSSKPHEMGDYGAEMCRDIVRLMDQLGLEQAHVGGYSLGGFITLKLASLYPERVSSAMVLGAGWERPENSTFFQDLQPYADKLEAGRGIDPPSGAMGKDRPQPTLIHRFFVRLLTGYYNDTDALAAVLRSAPGLQLTEQEVRQVELPVLAICGDQDTLFPGAQQLAEAAPNVRLIKLQGETHFSAPRDARMLAEMLRFLDEQEATPL